MYSELDKSISKKIERDHFGYINKNLSDNEIIIPKSTVDIFGQIFGTTQLVGQELKLVKKERNSNDGKILKEINVVIKKLSPYNDYYISRNIANLLREVSYFEGGIVVPLDQNVSNLLQAANNKDYDIFDVNSDI